MLLGVRALRWLRGAARVSLALFFRLPALAWLSLRLLALCEADGACRRAPNSCASAEPVCCAGERHARRRSKLVSCAREGLH